MTPIIAFISICCGLFFLSVLAHLTDERATGQFLLVVLVVLTLPLWLPLAGLWHVCGMLAGDYDLQGRQK